MIPHGINGVLMFAEHSVSGLTALIHLGIMVVVPIPIVAQSGYVIDGRVIDGSSGVGIANAVVELGDEAATLSSVTGAFHFNEVAAGAYTLRVRALGYVPSSQSIAVEANLTVSVILSLNTIELEPLIILAPNEIEVEGRVVDSAAGKQIIDADILTSHGQSITTDIRGRFQLDALDGEPLMVVVRAFGFLPFDSVVVPTAGERYTFALTADLLVQRMIAVELERLDARAGGLRTVTMAPLHRDELLRWNRLPVSEVLLSKYPRRRHRIDCLVIDEEVVTPVMQDATLENLMAHEVQRMEFLFRGAMLRVYTRHFIRRMLGGGHELRRPTYVNLIDPPMCS